MKMAVVSVACCHCLKKNGTDPNVTQRKVKSSVCTVLHEDRQQEKKMNGTTNIPGRTLGAMNVVQVMSLTAREEVSLSLLNEDNDIPKVPTLPSFDSSKDDNDDGENENETDNRLEVVKQENDVGFEKNTSRSSAIEKMETQQDDESVVDDDKGVSQKESQVATQANTESSQRRQQDVSKQVELLPKINWKSFKPN
jgi:hypothetical protein